MAKVTTTEPLWRRVYDDLRNRITTGQLQPGDRLPSEPELMRLHGVGSRTTISAAMRALMGDGLIDVRRRVAVRRPVTLRVSDEETLSFITDLTAAGHVTEEPDITVRIQGDGLIRYVLRTVDREPHNWARWEFPLEIAQGTRLAYDVDIPEGSVRYIKEGLGWTGLKQEKWIEARMPTPQETAVLQMTGGPVIVEHREGSQEGTRLFASVRILRADRTRLVP